MPSGSDLSDPFSTESEVIMKILIDGTVTPLSGSFGNLEEVLQEILRNRIGGEKIV